MPHLNSVWHTLSRSRVLTCQTTRVPTDLSSKLRSDGIKLINSSRYLNKHEDVDPGDIHHVSVARGCRIEWDSQPRIHTTPRLHQSGDHSEYEMTHLSCMDDNVTLLVPETKPQDVDLGSTDIKLSILVSTMREEKWFEKMIEPTRSAFMI